MGTAFSGDVIRTDYLLPYFVGFITLAISFSFLLKRVLAPGGNRMTRLLGMSQLERSADVRAEEVRRLVESIGEVAKAGHVVDLCRELTKCTNNIICSMAISCRCSGSDNEADEIQELAKTCLILGVKLRVGDVLGPWLRKLDFSGNGKKLVSTLMKYDSLIEKIMQEHERDEADGSEELLSALPVESHGARGGFSFSEGCPAPEVGLCGSSCRNWRSYFRSEIAPWWASVERGYCHDGSREVYIRVICFWRCLKLSNQSSLLIPATLFSV